MDTWLSQIDLDDLVPYAPPLLLLNIDKNATLDDVAALLVEGGPQIFASLPHDTKDKLIRGSHGARSESPTDHRPPKEWWDAVKDEFHEFLCSDSEKYESLRTKIGRTGEITGATILSIVAAAIGDALGFKVGAITGLVAVCLYGAAHIGKEAYCKIYNAT